MHSLEGSITPVPLNLGLKKNVGIINHLIIIFVYFTVGIVTAMIMLKPCDLLI